MLKSKVYDIVLNLKKEINLINNDFNSLISENNFVDGNGSVDDFVSKISSLNSSLEELESYFNPAEDKFYLIPDEAFDDGFVI